MGFSEPTLPELQDRIEVDIKSELGLTVLIRRSVLWVLGRAMAGAAHLLHRHIGWALRQAFPDTAELAYLERHASFYDVTRKEPDYSEGSVLATSTGIAWIPKGARLSRVDGFLFEATATVNVDGTASVPVKAVEPGLLGDTTADAELKLVSGIAFVNGVMTVEAPGIAGGSDAETDEALRSRLLAKRRQPPMGGAEHDYVTWALEVPGVTRAWALSTYPGAGMVGVTFATDNASGGPIPAIVDVEAVQAHLEEVRPLQSVVTAFAPTEVQLNPRILVTPDTTEVRAAVEASLTDMLRRESEPSATIYLSHVREAVSQAQGETDNQVLELAGEPAADVVLAITELATLGTITWV